MARQYLGRAKVYYDGKLLDTLPGASLMPGGVERKVVTNEFTVGFCEANKPSMLKCEISFDAGTDLEDIKRIAGATLQFVTDVNQTFVINNAFLHEPPTITGGDGGKLQLEFTGEPAIRA